MSDRDLIGIGEFALATGLTINALRHYDGVGLLRPGYVDPQTGYRRYRPDQIRQAMMVCALRRIDLPIDEVRRLLGEDGSDGTALRAALHQHRQMLLDRARALTEMVKVVDSYIENGVLMPELKTPRIVQVTINVSDLPTSIAFYREAFEATWNEDISSFQFGVWPTDDFFLLSVAHEPNHHGEHAGPAGASRFGLNVAGIDATHRRALAAGATEVQAPYKVSWKPRTSCVRDPSGNYIDLYEAGADV